MRVTPVPERSPSTDLLTLKRWSRRSMLSRHPRFATRFANIGVELAVTSAVSELQRPSALFSVESNCTESENRLERPRLSIGFTCLVSNHNKGSIRLGQCEVR